jgi:hypothetical protein
MKDSRFAKQSSIIGEMDTNPLCLRVRAGLKDDLKSIPGWQNKLRKVIDDWLKEELDRLH